MLVSSYDFTENSLLCT